MCYDCLILDILSMTVVLNKVNFYQIIFCSVNCEILNISLTASSNKRIDAFRKLKGSERNEYM